MDVVFGSQLHRAGEAGLRQELVELVRRVRVVVPARGRRCRDGGAHEHRGQAGAKEVWQHCPTRVEIAATPRARARWLQGETSGSGRAGKCPESSGALTGASQTRKAANG